MFGEHGPRVFTQQSYRMFGGVNLWLADRLLIDGAPTDRIVQPVELITSTYDQHTTVEPTMSLTEAMAKALLESLAAHFGGTGDIRTLRRDYDAERARVDKMIAHLIEGNGR